MKEYGYEIEEFNIGLLTPLRFAQWCHPYEKRKIFSCVDVEKMKLWVHEGFTCLDIGAYTGDTTVIIAAAAGKTGHVIAFEPNPCAYKILTINSQLNPEIACIQIENVAIMETPGEFLFSYIDEDFCNGGYYKTVAPDHTHRLIVQGLELKQYIKNIKIDFLKIDAEGYDQAIIESNLWLLERDKPTLVFEVYPYLTLKEKKILCDTITKANYCMKDVFSGADLLSDDVLSITSCYNIVAIPQ